MGGWSELVLGLGLFFLGIQLVGENLRRLTGPSFRRAIQGVSERPLLAGVTGVGFGALMQSATAVTFIIAGMVRSGLVTVRGAGPVILWCNVGLTALAFLVTFQIQPYVAYLVGGAGIFSGVVRQPRARAIAGVLLGVGLVLFGLESMGEGAAPFREEEWFRQMLAATLDAPMIAFGIGIVAAAILQSNAGAAMLVITLAGVGSFTVPQAAMLIYGTNLGAIGLRAFLAFNLDRPSQRLVRFEDVFCVVSGLLMTALFFAEQAGVPLVLAAVDHVEGGPKLQLACVFLLSNLLPAVLLSFLIGPIMHGLERWLPGESSGALGQPLFLSESALSDPPAGLEAMRRELARLLVAVHVHPQKAEVGADGDPEGDPAFGQLSTAIEEFGARLATRSALSEAEAHSLHLLRAELSLVRYFEDAVLEFNDALAGVHHRPELRKAIHELKHGLHELILAARRATAERNAETGERLRGLTKRRGEFVSGQVVQAKAQSTAPEVAALADAFELAAWMLHRLSKVLVRGVEAGSPGPDLEEAAAG